MGLILIGLHYIPLIYLRCSAMGTWCNMVPKTQIPLIWLNTWPVHPKTHLKPLKRIESNPITCCIMSQVLLPNRKMFYSCSGQMNGASSFVSQYTTVIFKLRHGSDTHCSFKHCGTIRHLNMLIKYQNYMTSKLRYIWETSARQSRRIRVICTVKRCARVTRWNSGGIEIFQVLMV
jgi:hypothetical protein